MLVALALYLAPFFRPLSMAPAMIAFLFLASMFGPGLLQAFYGAVILALIFGIKDLVIVNRVTAYQALVLLISFAGSILLFGAHSAWSAPASFLSLAVSVCFWFWLLRAFPDASETGKPPVLLPAIAALVLFEVGAVMFFLPINFFVQATLLFLASAMLLEAATNPGSITPKRVLVWVGGYAAISLFLVFLVSWKV